MLKKFLPIFLLIFSIQVFAVAQTDEEVKPTREDRLDRIQKNLILLSKRIKTKKVQISQEDSSLKIKLHLELENLNKEFASLQSVFTQVVTGVDLDIKQNHEDNKKASLSQDLQEILMPVLEVFKDVSQKPRKIEKLKQRKEKTNKRMSNLKIAIAKLD